MSALRTTREIPAIPADIFAAIREPTRLAQWWGPNGFTNAFTVFEFKPGGRWIFTMIGPDGAIYPNESTFLTLERDRQVVIRHDSAPKFVLTISLQPTPVGTLVTWEQIFDDPTLAKAIRPIIEPATEQNLDRLSRAVRS